MLQEAKTLFHDTAIKFTVEGKRHLGASLGSNSFRVQYVSEKVNTWCKEVEKLSEFAKTQPHAAFSAFIHGEQHKLTYFMRTIPGMEEHLTPLDKVINDKFLPALFGSRISSVERDLFSLPIRAGGLGIPKFAEKASQEYSTSRTITAPLVAIMTMQDNTQPNEDTIREIKNQATKTKADRLETKSEEMQSILPENVQRAVLQAKEKGSTNWLTALPLQDHGLILNKGEFRDALNLKYNRPIKGLPTKCPCGQNFNVTHAMNCKKGGFVIIRHNELRDFEANLLNKVCNDVEIEPRLQPLEGEQMTASTIDGDEARLDIRARGFWRPGQSAYFDVRVTNTDSESVRHMPLRKIYEKHEKEKKRHYNDRVMNIEHGTFTPLVFSVNGGIGPECLVFHKHLADKIAAKNRDRYELVLTWIRCKLFFLVLKASLLCLHGSRIVKNNKLSEAVDDFGLACHETRLS